MNERTSDSSKRGTSGIVHQFVAGLVFDRQLSYQVRTARGLRRKRLPWPDPANQEHRSASSGWWSALQCISISSRSADPFRNHGIGMEPMNAAEMTEMIAACAFAIVETHEGLTSNALGRKALNAIRAGDACMALLSSRRGTHWAMIAGVELRSGIADQPLTLLILETQFSEPWACGYNARLKLAQGPLIYRSLTDDICTVSIDALIIVRQVNMIT